MQPLHVLGVSYGMGADAWGKKKEYNGFSNLASYPSYAKVLRILTVKGLDR